MKGVRLYVYSVSEGHVPTCITSRKNITYLHTLGSAYVHNAYRSPSLEQATPTRDGMISLDSIDARKGRSESLPSTEDMEERTPII